MVSGILFYALNKNNIEKQIDMNACPDENFDEEELKNKDRY